MKEMGVSDKCRKKKGGGDESNDREEREAIDRLFTLVYRISLTPLLLFEIHFV